MVALTEQPDLLSPPDNYDDLDAETQRAIRLEIITQQETPADLVNAWRHFRKFYLEPVDAGWFKRLKPSPPMHYQMIFDLGEYSKNAWAAPRSFAKSTVMREVAMMLMLTRPRFDVMLVQATIKKYRKSIDAIKWQFENNKYLDADFGPLRAKKGQRQWSTESLRVPNGSVLDGGSVEGALRGDRPDLLLIDDPEYDEDEGMDSTILMERFERLMFRTLRPMLDEGTGMFWIGTLISRKSYLYVATQSEDKRFKYWNRRVLQIEDENGNPIWDAKWNKQKIADLREEVGESSFQSEYMNNPGSGTERILKIHPDMGAYRVDGAPPEKDDNPLDSPAVIRYRVATRIDDRTIYTEKREAFGSFVGSMFRIMTVDYVRRPSSTSDFACIIVMGFDSNDVLWVLDIFHDKLRPDAVIRRMYDMAMQWRVKLVGSESESIESLTTDRAQSMIAQMGAHTGYIPKVIPIKYASKKLTRNTDAPAKIDKAERIAGMEWRFNQHLIRLPFHREMEPGVRQLIYQIENFTMDLALLRHDDAIDTLAMHQFMIRRKGGKRRRPVDKDSAQAIATRGDVLDPRTGLPRLAGFGDAALNSQVVDAVRDRRYADRFKKPPGVTAWPGLIQIGR